MRRVMLESPYAGEIERNIVYALACAKDCLQRGEAPFASHLLFTLILDDLVEQEREWGIQAGFAWRSASEASVAYTDFGITRGMRYGIEQAEDEDHPVEYRTLFKTEEDREAFLREVPERLEAALKFFRGEK